MITEEIYDVLWPIFAINIDVTQDFILRHAELSLTEFLFCMVVLAPSKYMPSFIRTHSRLYRLCLERGSGSLHCTLNAIVGSFVFQRDHIHETQFISDFSPCTFTSKPQKLNPSQYSTPASILLYKQFDRQRAWKSKTKIRKKKNVVWLVWAGSAFGIGSRVFAISGRAQQLVTLRTRKFKQVNFK